LPGLASKISNVLVTGGAGFVGSHLVEGLLQRGFEVGVLDNFSTGDASNLESVKERIRIHRGDIRDASFVAETIKGYDAVAHEAALVSVPRSIEDPATSNAVNLDGTLNVLVAARDAGVERVIYASSSSVYGETKVLPKEESMKTLPISPHGVSKLAAENYTRVFARVYGLKTVCLRYFNVYGPRQRHGAYSGVIPNFVRAVMNNESPVIYGDGKQTRDFTFVEDVVQANMLCLEKPVKGGEIFNVGSHARISINLLARTIAQVAGRPKIRPKHVAPRPGDIIDSYADISRISAALGYRPKYTLETGLRKVVDWVNDIRSTGTVR
jgi:nucleoside-diphosphate-sugar epimerase